jgi:hypothetical protein
MIRACVVNHPAEWAFCGYQEIQGKRRRNTLPALDTLAEVTEVSNPETLSRALRDSPEIYEANSNPENPAISPNNSILWKNIS